MSLMWLNKKFATDNTTRRKMRVLGLTPLYHFVIFREGMPLSLQESSFTNDIFPGLLRGHKFSFDMKHLHVWEFKKRQKSFITFLLTRVLTLSASRPQLLTISPMVYEATLEL